MRTPAQGPYRVQYTGSWLYQGAGNDENKKYTAPLLLCMVQGWDVQSRVSAKFEFIYMKAWEANSVVFFLPTIDDGML